ncbi:MAG: phenylalanine--tRNA ligase subunit beta [Candidatus Saccharimonadales bacterium]
MKVSLNAVKQYTDIDLPLDDLVARINQQLGGVEEVIDLAQKYKGITIVKVVECAPLEGSDHLNVTKVDDGGVTKNVERDENGFVQVVCGAPNVHAGMYSVWLAPGVTVPDSYDDEPFVLSAKPLRGVVSNGMLASNKELALGDSHEGILEINPDEWKPSTIEIKPGTDFAKAYGLDDYIIDIENKMFTHRPDCFGQLGVAREIAGILGQQFVSPDWYKMTKQFGVGEGLALSVQNDIPNKVPRFMAVAIKDVTIKPSPVWLQAELVRLGSKPINTIVDVTNYVMLLTAQPLHAYDYDKVASGKLGIRLAREDETIKLLGGKDITLHSADVVVTDGEKPIGLAGVMGGAETEVSAETKNIIIECANFDMFTIRRTSMRHGIFTDAVTRFTKGQSTLQNPAVLNLVLTSVFETAGGKQASDVIDSYNGEAFDDQSLYGTKNITRDFINKRLGSDFTVDYIAKLLRCVEFTVSSDEEIIEYSAPFWRTDIEISEDIVEEVGRLYGFDNLPQQLPWRTVTSAPINSHNKLKLQLRDILSRAGANEVLTYSFVHKKLLEKANQNPEDTYRLSNSLSPDLHYLRRTILPSLLDKVHSNVKAGYEQFALFEIGKGHKKSAGVDEQGVPNEQQYVALALAGGDFYSVKAFTEFIARNLWLKFEYVPVEQGKLFEPKRSALIKANGEIIGAVGEFRNGIKRNFKLPEIMSGFEIDFDKLLSLASEANMAYHPISRFPSAQRDVTIRVQSDVTYAQVEEVALKALEQSGLEIIITPQGIYQPEDGETKNITLRIMFTSYEKTLTGDDLANVMNTLVEYVSSKLGASII